MSETRSHRDRIGKSGIASDAISHEESMDRRPPSDLEAEKCVIGSICLDTTMLDNVKQILGVDDFFDETNRILFRVISEIIDERSIFDPVVLRDRLVADDVWDTIGGASTILKITEIPTPAHATHYANIVKDHSLRRQAIETGLQMLSNAYDTSIPVRQVVEQAQSGMFDLADAASSGVAVHRVGDVMEAHLDRLEKIRAGEVDLGISCHIDNLNTYLQFRPSEVTILGARPSQGKSALAMNICDHVTRVRNEGCLFVSLEMSEADLLNRYLSSMTDKNLMRFQHGNFNDTEMQEIIRVGCSVRETPLYFMDSTEIRISQIATVARQLHRSGNCRLLVVDYLQLVTPETQRDHREQQVAKMSRSLKKLARELKIPVLVLAQVNRKAGDEGRAPKLSDLRESGAIEQDADNVVFVHRPSYYRPQPDEDVVDNDLERAELHIAKQRNGPTGVAEVQFAKTVCRFENIEPTEEWTPIDTTDIDINTDESELEF